MSRALLIVDRLATARLQSLDALVGTLVERLTPDHIEARPPVVHRADGIVAVIFDPAGGARISGTSIRLGVLADDPDNWHVPGAGVPEGSFALLRSNRTTVELVADAAGTRTIWYAIANDRLVASTSQRAIAYVLGGFELNRRVIPWMLSTGTLGPVGGWDARLEAVRPGERLTFAREGWARTSTYEPICMAPNSRLRRGAHARRIQQAVFDVCGRMQFDFDKWVLPLSGGVDSRGLLTLFPARHGLRTVTWGQRASRGVRYSDAAVASIVAARLGIANRYYCVDLSDEPRDRLVDRFLVAGEGRAAKMSGYLDGFRTWKVLREAGIEGIIRGDEAFGGSRFVYSDRHVRGMVALTTMSDFLAPRELDRLELPAQPLPAEGERRPGESLAMWRDRLYWRFRAPVFLAALTDLKTPYVEVANPLLCDSVLRCVRELPDHLRTRKQLWEDIVRARMRDVPFARKSNVVPMKRFVQDPEMLDLMLAELGSTAGSSLFSPAFTRRLCSTVEAALRPKDPKPRRRSFKPLVAAVTPNRIRTEVRRRSGPTVGLDPLELAFRAFLLTRMTRLLESDAAAAAGVRLREVANR